MVFEVIFSPKAEQELKKLDRMVQERIIKVLERIRIRPESFVEKLVGEEGYKLRVGDYRLYLDIQNDKLIIWVIKVGHRRNFYKNQ